MCTQTPVPRVPESGVHDHRVDSVQAPVTNNAAAPSGPRTSSLKTSLGSTRVHCYLGRRVHCLLHIELRLIYMRVCVCVCVFGGGGGGGGGGCVRAYARVQIRA